MALIQYVDQEIVKVATQIGGQSELRDQIVYVCAELLPFAIVAAAVWIFARGGKTKQQRDRNQNVVLIGLAAVVISIGVRWLGVQIFPRDRPFVTLPDIHHLDLVSSTSSSFPSLHALMLFSFVGTLYFIGHHPKWSKLLLVIASVAVLARVIAGVHYPSDILVGAALGLLVARVMSWQSDVVEGRMD